MLKDFATVDPGQMSGSSPAQAWNLCAGSWQYTGVNNRGIIDPLNGEVFLTVPVTRPADFSPFIDSLATCPKYGRHNPFYNVERYRMLGQVSAKAGQALDQREVEDFFTRLIMRVMPKSYAQAKGEVVVTKHFLQNFSGDQVRFLATGFTVPGDYLGQMNHGYRWPYGPVVIICPFNFPLEIPALQLMGTLYMGNKPLVKVDSKVSVVAEQFIRLLHHCGLPLEDVDMIHCRGEDMGMFLEQAKDIIRLVQFTGSSSVAEEVSRTMGGRVRIEDAGFDWKLLGPDADEAWLDYVAWTSDQDAYAASGQKCSAQSILFVHKKWLGLGLLKNLQEMAARRRLDNLTIGPVLTWTTEQMMEQIRKLLTIDGAILLFGGQPLEDHRIPSCYGALQPTAIYVPLGEIMPNFELVTTEVFGPVQVLTDYGADQLEELLALLERMDQHLTAAIVSNDPEFITKVAGATVNGTTYAGMRARTTGAPQNHWFGPAGDPRAAGIGSPGSIISTWSCHREVIYDSGPLPDGWQVPDPS